MSVASPHMSAEPYWWDAAPPSETIRQAVDSECDVAVIGGGYTGLSAAHTLALAGRSVQLFERDRAGEGASTRNGGITSGSLRLSLANAIKTYGEAKGIALFKEARDARQDLYAFIKEHEIDCDLQQNGRFTGVFNANDYEDIAREADLFQKHVGLDAQIISKSELSTETGSGAYCGGFVQPDIATFHPAKFHACQLAITQSAGAKVHTNLHVLGVKRDGGAYNIATTRGTVRTRDVIIATNGYTDASDRWLRRRLVPVKSRIVVTEEISQNLMRHLMPKGRAMGEKRFLYRYFRPTPDGKRIMLGGREPAFPGSAQRASNCVRSALLEVFPELEDVAISHSWAGNVAFSLDQLPRLFSHDGMHYAVGFCGSGTVWARWLGKKAALKILGSEDARSAFECEPPRALPFYNGRPWFLPAAMLYYKHKDRKKMARAPK